MQQRILLAIRDDWRGGQGRERNRRIRRRGHRRRSDAVDEVSAKLFPKLQINNEHFGADAWGKNQRRPTGARHGQVQNVSGGEESSFFFFLGSIFQGLA